MASFIVQNMEEIVAEWEAFARTLTPAASTMDSASLRDHAKQMLKAIAKDIETDQTDREQALKSKGLAPDADAVGTAAAVHGVLRHRVGFDISQVVAEFRALRASVLRIWIRKERYADAEHAYELARFNEAIDQALAESVATYSGELTRSRETFLGILGHDLRSPLGAISNVLRVLSKDPDAEVRAKAIATATRSVAAMAAMIRDLLEYTRSRLGTGIPVVPVPGDLDALCRVAIDEISQVFPQTAFRYESEGRLDGVFDAERLHQVISNLLNNAVQHGYAEKPVRLVATGDEDALHLRVTNEGPVIEPSDLERIFEPMVQLAGEDERRSESTNLGLGLFIARQIALAHGGKIDVSSDRGATTFAVSLPRKAAAQGGPDPAAAKRAP